MGQELKGHCSDVRLGHQSGARNLGMRGLLAAAIALALLLSPVLAAPVLAALIADPGGPYSGVVDEKIQFDGSQSAGDDDIDKYEWDFGDGKDGKGVSPKHAYKAAGVYTVRLTVTDDDGNTSWAETTATIVDEVPLVVFITQPSPNSTVSGITPVVATTSDDQLVSNVQFRVDGVSIGSASGPPWSVDWDTTTATNDNHTLTAIATDSLGRTSQASIPVNVSNTPVSFVSITSPLDGSVVQGRVSITASASSDISFVQFTVDGRWIGTDFFGFNGWSTNWSTSAETDGDHTVSAIAHDRQGRTSTDSVKVTVQNTPPTTTTTTTTSTTTTTLPTTTTSTTTTTLPTTTTSTTTVSTTTSTTTPITSTTAPPPSTTVTIDATTSTLEVLGQRLDATTRARGVSAASFEVTPLTGTPGDEITLVFELDATAPGFTTVLFLLDGDPLGTPAQVTTGTEMTFTRVLPDDLVVGSHRIELVTDEDPPRVLASRTVGVAASATGQAVLPPPITPVPSQQNASLLPALGVLFLAAISAVTWRNRHRWIPRRTRT